MKQKRFVKTYLMALLLLAFLFVGLPWFSAYRSHCSTFGYLGVDEGKQLQTVSVDKTHFEAHGTAVWFDESLSITGEDGVIYCNGMRIDFPRGKNVALVRRARDIIFVELDEKYFEKSPNRSEVVYIFGKVPHFKKMNKGLIDLQKVKEDQIISEEWATFLGASR